MNLDANVFNRRTILVNISRSIHPKYVRKRVTLSTELYSVDWSYREVVLRRVLQLADEIRYRDLHQSFCHVSKCGEKG